MGDLGAAEIAQWVKAFATKLGDMSLIVMINTCQISTCSDLHVNQG